MKVCSMTRFKVKVKVTSQSKSEIRPFSTAIFIFNGYLLPIYNGGWQVTTNS